MTLPNFRQPCPFDFSTMRNTNTDPSTFTFAPELQIRVVTQARETADLKTRLAQDDARAVRAELERWRDYAIALDAERQARNIAVSAKTRKLDPRR